MGKKRVIVIVQEGCAEIYEQPDDVNVVIVDRDGSFPFYCEQCDDVWDPDDDPDWGKDPVQAPDEFIRLCPHCRATGSNENDGDEVH